MIFFLQKNAFRWFFTEKAIFKKKLSFPSKNEKKWKVVTKHCSSSYFYQKINFQKENAVFYIFKEKPNFFPSSVKK